MDIPYDQRKRLAHALHPQTEAEHRVIDHLVVTMPRQLPTLVEMIERRRRTDRRSARMGVAQLAVEFMQPAPGSPPDIAARMERIAEGGDDADVA